MLESLTILYVPNTKNKVFDFCLMLYSDLFFITLATVAKVDNNCVVYLLKVL